MDNNMDIEEVRKKLKEHNFILLSKEYNGNKSDIDIEDENGYRYSTTWNCISKTWKPFRWYKTNKYSAYNLNKYITEELKGVTNSIVVKYKGTTTILKCKCGKEYEVYTNNLLSNKNTGYNCPSCSYSIRAKKFIKNEYLDFLKENQYQLLDEYKGCKYSYYIKTKNGLIGKSTLWSLYKENTNIEVTFFAKYNKYAIYNIQHYFDINNINLKVLTKQEEYGGVKKKIKLLCSCGDTFEIAFQTLKSINKTCCNKCSDKNRIQKHFDNTDKSLFEKYGLTLLEQYQGKYKYIYCIDKNGYYVHCSLYSLESHINYDCTRFTVDNKYVEYNIQKYLDDNNIELTLLKYYNSRKMKIRCKCGNEYYDKFDNIKKGRNCCKKCYIKTVSNMEKFVNKYLTYNNVEFEPQKTFNECIDKRNLSFDFYLPKYNCCIECQGIQHYEPIDYFGGLEHFIYVVNHDIIKRDYCLKNNIKLTKICYLDFDNNGNNEKIVKILKSIINT